MRVSCLSYLTVASLFSLTSLFACSGEAFDSGDSPPSQAGSSGTNSGGTTGGGGSGGTNAGTGGVAGVAGMAGASGSPQAGNGGEAGANPGGNAGNGGAQGGAAGSDPNGQPCEVGTFACNNNTLLTCSAQTKTFTPIDTCADDGFCDAQAGTCKACKPGAVLGCASDSTRSLCSDDGIPGELQVCPLDVPYCVGGGECVACTTEAHCPALGEGNECYQPQCLSNTCTKTPRAEGTKTDEQPASGCAERLCDGQGKASETPFSAGTTCNSGQGVCNGKGGCGVCLPGAKECVDGGSVRVCSDEGQWLPTQACSDKPVCEAGACVGVTQVASGNSFSCALLESGNLRCWGNIATLFDAKTFQSGFKNIKQISANDRYFCALDKAGDIYCAGLNDKGQFGNGEKSSISEPIKTPTKVKAEVKFRHLDTGVDFACAVSEASGDLYCWGSNATKQIPYKPGQPLTVSESLLPYKVPGVLPFGDKVVAALGSQHGCVSNVGLYCWGQNSSGQVGVSSTISPAPLTKIDVGSVLIGVNVLAASSANTIGVFDEYNLNGLITKSTIKLWGNNPVNSTSSFTPVEVLNGLSGTSVASLATSDKVLAAVSKSGEITIVGSNENAQVGNNKQGKIIEAYIHLDVPRDGVSIGTNHVCAWKTGGQAWCWGKNEFAQTGTANTNTYILKPTLVKW